MTLHELQCQRAIHLRGRSARSVFEKIRSEAGTSLTQNAPRDDSLINAFTEMFSDVSNYLLAKLGPRIEHRHNNPAKLETIVRA